MIQWSISSLCFNGMRNFYGFCWESVHSCVTIKASHTTNSLIWGTLFMLSATTLLKEMLAGILNGSLNLLFHVLWEIAWKHWLCPLFNLTWYYCSAWLLLSSNAFSFMHVQMHVNMVNMNLFSDILSTFSLHGFFFSLSKEKFGK